MTKMTIEEWVEATEQMLDFARNIAAIEQTMRGWADAATTYRILTEEEYYEANLEYEEWLAEQYIKDKEEK